MQFFQHLNQPIPPPNTNWTSSTVQIKKGTRPFPGLIEPVRDTYVYERCMHESWWSSYWLLLMRLFPPFLSFYCLMPSH